MIPAIRTCSTDSRQAAERYLRMGVVGCCSLPGLVDRPPAAAVEEDTLAVEGRDRGILEGDMPVGVDIGQEGTVLKGKLVAEW